MLEMYKGCEVPDVAKLSAGYELLGSNMLQANVDAGKIKGLLLDFAAMHKNEQVYFMLELPPEHKAQLQVSYGQNELDEDSERYYIDDISLEQVQELLAKVGDVLINDGVSRFSLGGTYSMDEMVVDRFNVLSVMSVMDVEEYEKLFTKQGIPKVEGLVTAWETFSPEEPATAMQYVQDNISVFDIPAMFAAWGMYMHTIRPDE